MISESVRKYEERTAKSKMLFEKAVKTAPGGVHHNIRYYPPYPLFIERGNGSRIWDVDGNEYIDFWMGHGALILGHAHHQVVKALQEQCTRSTQYGMPNDVQVQLGVLIQEMAPWAERIRFANTGTEATMYAVRFARAYTGKKKIAKFEGQWHGGHDILNVAVTAPTDKPSTAGVLPETAAHSIVCPFNDTEQTLNLLERHSHDLAAVIVEPVTMVGGAIGAEKDFLKALREKCDKLSSVLIFDEVVTGFRLAKGGATELYGVKPDLLTYGKVIGGGCPVGAIAGKTEVMSVCDPSRDKRPYEVAQHGGTFCGNPLTMTAGYTTLKILNEHPEIYSHINKLGQEARIQVDKVFKDAGMPTQTTGVGSMFITHFLKKEGSMLNNFRDIVEKTERERMFDYYFELMNHGVFFLSKHIGLIGSAHSEEDIDRLVEASQKTTEVLRKKG